MGTGRRSSRGSHCRHGARGRQCAGDAALLNNQRRQGRGFCAKVVVWLVVVV
jgi:hypothetical protein